MSSDEETDEDEFNVDERWLQGVKMFNEDSPRKGLELLQALPSDNIPRCILPYNSAYDAFERLPMRSAASPSHCIPCGCRRPACSGRGRRTSPAPSRSGAGRRTTSSTRSRWATDSMAHLIPPHSPPYDNKRGYTSMI